MAKITLGPIVDSVRGSIGGVTFRKVGTKFIASKKSMGPVRAGSGSSQHYVYMKQATSAWYQLAAPVKEFWSRYHALQKPHNPRSGQPFPTAYSLFTCYQLMRLHCGVAMLIDSVPDPPIFSAGTLTWDGPYASLGSPIEGYIQMYYQEEEQVDKICVFCSTSKNGVTPGRFPSKVFPTPVYPSGRVVANMNGLIYDKLGYPPGITGLITQPAQPLPLYLLSGWGIWNDLIWPVPWTLPELRGDEFRWPVATPIIYG